MAKFKCNICGQTFEADKMPDKCPICGADNTNIEEIVEETAGQETPAAPKKKGIDTNSNIYTIVYAAVMVIIVAFLLAYVSIALGDKQKANVENDTKGQILMALGYNTDSVDVTETYNQKVQDNIYKDDALTPCDPADFQTTYGQLIKDGVLHVFVATTNSGEKAYVIPVTGRGLWGGLWGYVAVDEAKTKVLGTFFNHESETAGLGARIKESWFQQQFIGKDIYGADGNIALTVVKAGSADKDSKTEVNGVTGATLTSKGVAAMLKDGLGAYADFLKAGVATDEAKCCDNADCVCKGDTTACAACCDTTKVDKK